MNTPVLAQIFRRGVALAAALLLAFGGGPAQEASAQDTQNMTILSNFGRGEGETRTTFALGSRAYYGVGNTVAITDFTNPATPVKLGSVSVSDRVEDIVVVGNTLYVAHGAGVAVFNVQNPTAPVAQGTVEAESYGEGLAVDPPYILFGDGSAGLRIIDATDPASLNEVAQLDTLGYVEGVSYTGGKAFVSAGSRIHFIDYATPSAPTYAGRLDQPLDYYQSTAARGNFLYVADFFGGVRIFDVSNPASPSDVGFFDPADRTARIALDADVAYVANGDKGVTVLDVSDNASPSQLAVIATAGRALQTWVSGTRLFVAVTAGIQVFDITTPSSPSLAGAVAVEAAAEGKAFGLTLAGDYAYVAYGDAGLRILDISNPAGGLPQVGQVDVQVEGEGAARQVVVKGTTAYVAARGPGVQIVDVSDPASPSVVGTIDTGEAGDVALEGDILAVATGSGAMFYDVSNATSPTQLFASDGIGYSDRVGLSGSYGYAITEGSNVRVFDLTNTASISLVGAVATGGDYSEGRITVQDGLLYTTNGDLLIVDVSTPASPTVRGTFDSPSYAYSANVSGMYAYVASERNGVRIVDVSDPANPVEAGFAEPGDQIRDIAVKGSMVFAANGESGVTAMLNTLATDVARGDDLPGRVALTGSFPNPARSETTITFDVHEAGFVTLDVFDLLGRRVATLAAGHRAAGPHAETLDASALPNGSYVYRLSAGGDVATRMLVVLR